MSFSFSHFLFIVGLFPAGMSMAQSNIQAQIDALNRVAGKQQALLQDLARQRPIMVSTTRRPGDYGSTGISIPMRSGSQGAADMFKFGDTFIKIEQPRRVFVSATVTFRPINYPSPALGIAVTATKGNQVIVLYDTLNPLKSLNRGSGDGPYFRPAADAYTSIPVSGVLELPESGEWKLQILVENNAPDPITVHTFSLTGIAI